MMSGLNLSAAACNAATSSIARKALSFLRKPTCARKNRARLTRYRKNSNDFAKACRAARLTS